MSVYPDNKRRSPYVWTTWIVGLLAGTDKCEWKAWYKSNFRYAQIPPHDQASLDQWNKHHDAMSAEIVERLKSEGWDVSVEEANQFTLKGKTATLSGKPDIFALNKDNTLAKVIDAKTGTVKAKDEWQVLVYIFAYLIKWRNKGRGTELSGEVEYRSGSMPVRPMMPAVERAILNVMAMVGSKTEPPRVPSHNECRFCNIMYCPDRMSIMEEETEVDEF